MLAGVSFHARGDKKAVDKPSQPIHKSQPIHNLPTQPVYLSRKDLITLPTAYEKEAAEFKRIQQVVDDSEIPSRLDLISLLQRQLQFSEEIENSLSDQYTSYVSFIHETIRDLERIKEITTQEIPYEKIEFWDLLSTHFSNFIRNPPVFSELLLTQYQELLVIQKPKYQIPDTIESIAEEKLGSQMNETIQKDILNVTRSGLQKSRNRQNLKTLQQIEKDLLKPRFFERKVHILSQQVAVQLRKVLDECLDDSKRVPRYLMTWKNYIGTTTAEKKRLYDRKLFEIIGLSVDRVIERLKEMNQ